MCNQVRVQMVAVVSFVSSIFYPKLKKTKTEPASFRTPAPRGGPKGQLCPWEPVPALGFLLQLLRPQVHMRRPHAGGHPGSPGGRERSP